MCKGCLEDVWSVSRRCQEGVRKVSGRCLEGVWKVSGGILEGVRKAFGTHLEHVWRVFGMCQEGAWKESGQCLTVYERCLESIKIILSILRHILYISDFMGTSIPPSVPNHYSEMLFCYGLIWL